MAKVRRRTTAPGECDLWLGKILTELETQGIDGRTWSTSARITDSTWEPTTTATRPTFSWPPAIHRWHKGKLASSATSHRPSCAPWAWIWRRSGPPLPGKPLRNHHGGANQTKILRRRCRPRFARGVPTHRRCHLLAIVLGHYNKVTAPLTAPLRGSFFTQLFLAPLRGSFHTAPPPRVLFYATFFRRIRHLMHDTPPPSRPRL
jgi:hypothetical protein